MSAHFPGTRRFTISRTLGAGGFGVVYLAFDRDLQREVALKTLRRMDAAALVRFKQEFRALADISHPNLVTLYELLADGDQWFFTMELVRGATILDYVWTPADHDDDISGEVLVMAPPPWPAERDSDATTLRGSDQSTARDTAFDRGNLRPAGALNVARVRSAFHQLASGVAALHAGGLAHRDLKPSNVLATREGRIVVLDFGVASELLQAEPEIATGFAGTPAYSSPEQDLGQPVSEASDWYSVGCMLFQALTGQLPFSGSLVDVRDAKTRGATSASAVQADVPADLDALCLDLLHPDPARRPGAPEILRRLHDGHGGQSTVQVRSRGHVPLIGRAAHIADLEAAFDLCCDGAAVTVLLHGRSGMGKTTLARHFLRRVRDRHPEAILLAGRCYERETVPYKALDPIVDALAQHLRRAGTAEADRIRPRDAQPLARVFPVLRQVPAIAATRRASAEPPDSQELRRRAFAALGELLGRISDRAPIVIFIDDIQWGDLDSCALLTDLIARPDPPTLLLLVAYRDDDVAGNVVLRTLLPSLERASQPGCHRNITVDELDGAEVRELATALIGTDPDLSAGIDDIVRESRGSPFFVDALVTYAVANRAGETTSHGHTATLDRVIGARLAALPPGAAALLTAVAVSGGPLDLAVADRAAGLDGDYLSHLDALRNARLARTSRGVSLPQIETYHDRIREAVIEQLPPERLKAAHRALAQALVSVGGADPEHVATHFAQAGDHAAAAQHYARAAVAAADTLAFDRAARLFGLAIAGRSPDDPDLQSLRVGKADALANAGCGRDAAAAYLDAARSAGDDEACDLERRAAEQLLISGNIDEGLEVLRSVLAHDGLSLARTPNRALLSIVLQRARLALRGLEFRERSEAELSPREKRVIDACWSVAIGLGMVDNVRACDFQSRHVNVALRAGEPYRVARALAMEIGQRATGGGRTRPFTETLIARATRVTERVDRPHATALLALNVGVASYLWGDYPAAVAQLISAEDRLRDECSGVVWELDTTHIFWTFCHNWSGRWADLARRVPGFIAEVEARGDKYAATYMRLRSMHFLALAQDDVAGAREQQRIGIEGWSQQSFQTQHFSNWATCVEIDLYDGRIADAWRRMQSVWPAFRRSLVARVQAVLIQALDLRARCALAMAATASPADARRLLASADRDAALIEKERMSWGNGLASLTRASVAWQRGDAPRAVAHLIDAERRLDGSGMTIYAHTARRRRGQVIGGSDGPALVEDADRWMREQTVVSPARIAQLLMPGTWKA